ncbi:sulfite exporter TauE/SafE family protein [Acinetobacter courvalinii]|uniref:Probable membrane transporter protein n=1 Tax=Acinetobacter courvalinii TaxID=280147 RepID=A0AA42IAH8_9GAMM|nr:TSUP family transporter [Acinetobacter courvalinii]MDH0565515.1 TSUP family transporter [Acinetobacter courvalinii]
MTYDTVLLSLGFFAFCGGLIDAAVGGGGLVQIPALLHALPQHSMTTVLGTNKLAVWAGTVSSIFRYVNKIQLVWKLLIPTMLSAFIFAFVGAMTIAHIPKQLMSYLVLFLLIVMAVYTFLKKDLGTHSRYVSCGAKEIALGVFFGGLIGFYDGVFGPGSGSFLLFLFVKGFGFDFLNASASAKIVNIGTFSSALLFFIPTGHVLWEIGLMIAVCNVLGAFVGVFLALRYGSQFIRIFFLFLLVFLIIRMGLSIV